MLDLMPSRKLRWELAKAYVRPRGLGIGPQPHVTHAMRLRQARANMKKLSTLPKGSFNYVAMKARYAPVRNTAAMRIQAAVRAKIARNKVKRGVLPAGKRRVNIAPRRRGKKHRGYW